MSVSHLRPSKSPAFLCGAWLFLNLFLNINYPAPLDSWWRLLLPSLEVWGLLLALSLLAARGVDFTPRVYLPLMALFIFLRLFRCGDVLMPLYFNRPFNLYVDTGYVPGLLHLLYHSFSLSALVGGGLGVLALAVLLIGGLFASLRVAHAAFRHTLPRRGFWLLTAGQTLLVGIYLAGVYPADLPPPGTTVAPRLAAEADFIRRIRAVRKEGLSAVRMAAARPPRFQAPLAALAGRDVHLFLIESYGYTLFSHPRHAALFQPMARRFEATLNEAGLAVVSHCLQSPTFGGASWLAFATLESGVWVPNQIRYNFLLESRVRPLAEYFNQAGYRTVSVMPGTTLPWPEGDFFAYTRQYYAKDFQYRGPSFGWSPMSDQFVLDWIHRREIGPSRAPLFLRYVLISTHAPFHHQPGYIENWDHIGDGQIYHRLQPVTFPVNWPDLTTPVATEAYLRAIDYELRVLGDFLSRRIAPDSLVVIMGDHQPNAHISGDKAPWLVPVHVISRQQQLLQPFRQMGYAEGLTPRNPPPYKRMDTFMADFLTAYSR
jgi:hypothetical protein